MRINWLEIRTRFERMRRVLRHSESGRSMTTSTMSNFPKLLKPFSVSLVQVRMPLSPFRWRSSALLICVCLTSALLPGCGQGANERPAYPPAGSSEAEAGKTAFPGVTIKVASAEDPALGAVTADLVGEWRASRQAEVEVVELPKPADGKLADIPADLDVLLVRGDRIGELVDQDMIEKLGDLDADWATRPPAFEETVSRYGPDRYAVPIGTSVLVLAYREETFAAPETKAELEKAGVNFPPATWDEFDKLVALLAARSPQPIAQPTLRGPNDDLPLDILIARATAAGKHRDYFSFLMGLDEATPRIATPPFTESLAKIVKWRGKPGEKVSPDDARAAFRQGQASLLIDYAENAPAWSETGGTAKIGVAPLPGATLVYDPDRRESVKTSPPNLSAWLPRGGGYVAVLNKGRSGKQAEAARDFLKYLAGDATAPQWAADSRMRMLPTRDAVLAQGFVDPRIAPKVNGGAWGEAILKQIGSPNYVVGLRVPEARTMLDAVGKAVETAFQGTPAEKSLGEAEAAWKKTVAAYGTQRMKWHYGRSLVKPLTDPEAPPRGK